MEYRILKLSYDGTLHEMWSNHKDLCTHFDGPFTFCGAIHACYAFAICSLNQTDKPTNMFSQIFNDFFDTCNGDIILVGSDMNGMACDLDIDKLYDILQVI